MPGNDLINTLECPGEFDAMATLRPFEPYFLLVGRDRLAPGLVLKWAQDHRQRTLADENLSKEARALELRKATQAEEIAWAMQEYKKGHAGGVVVVETKTTSYVGAKLPEETLRRDKIQSARIKAASTLNAAEAALEDLRELDSMFNEYCLSAQCGPRDIRRLSSAVKPDRPGLGR